MPIIDGRVEGELNIRKTMNCGLRNVAQSGPESCNPRYSLLAALNLAYYLYVLLLSFLFGLFVPIYVMAFCGLKQGRFDDAVRTLIGVYGRFLIRASWPLIKTEVTGTENLPDKGPVVLILNHRSFIDIFFTALVASPNTAVVVRDWPFGLFILNWFMRGARYINIEGMSVEKLLKTGREFAQRDVSLLFFPEGHRSRDGKLLRFRSGAFLIALENNLPIVSVCMTGTEKLTSPHFPFIRPALIKLEILPTFFPSSFQSKDKVLRVRKDVVKMFREHLGK